MADGRHGRVLRPLDGRHVAAGKYQSTNNATNLKVAISQAKQSAKPHFSGGFYNDLTGGANSALSDAALNWGEYQYFARNAVNTGQANLAQLLSGLEAQEMDQNWPAISNVAGYVNGNAANLRTSIASEEGAIEMYAKFTASALSLGDVSAARYFTGVRSD